MNNTNNNTKTTVISIIVIIIIIGIGIYVYLSNNPSSIPVTSTVPSSNESAPSTLPNTTDTNVAIEASATAFTPASVTVKVGTTVVWTVTDNKSAQTINSDTGNLLVSGLIPPGGTFSYKFTEVGTNNYHSNIHPSSRGTVIVTN